MRETLIAIALISGVLWAFQGTSPLATKSVDSEFDLPMKAPQAPLRKMASNFPHSSAKTNSLQASSSQAISTDSSEESESYEIKTLGPDVPDKALVEQWERYRDEIYDKVQITNEERAQLTAIYWDDFGIDAEKVSRHYDELSETDQHAANKFIGEYSEQMHMLSTKAYEAYLGKERYQYVIKAREAFFDKYNKEHGTSIFIPEW